MNLIILPKHKSIISVYAQATTELEEDSEKFSQTCEQSLMWRSKPSLLRTWLQRVKRNKWMLLLSSRMLRLSHTESFVDAWTSYLLDSHANPFPPQEARRELKTQDTSTLISQMELPFVSQDMSSSKTSRESLVQKQQTANRYSSMSSETWKAEVTSVRGEHSARLKSVRHTLEKEYSSLQNWGTPQVTDIRGDARKPSERSERANKGGCSNLREQVHNFPPDPTKSNTTGKPLESYPTPRTSDAEGGRIETVHINRPAGGDGFKSYRKKSNQFFGAKLRDAVEMDKPKAAKLNPTWVEQMMGIPIGLTQLPTEWID